MKDISGCEARLPFQGSKEKWGELGSILSLGRGLRRPELRGGLFRRSAATLDVTWDSPGAFLA